MRTRDGHRCPRRIARAASVMAAAAVICAPSAAAAPYVSCPGGYLTTSYDECPQVPQHRPPAPYGGHGGPHGGLLGGLLGGLGL